MKKPPPALVFDEQLASGWARIELYGDRDKAGGLIHQARMQLGGMRVMYGVNQRIAEGESGGFYHATKTLDDGSVIQTISNDGQDMIRIHASSSEVKPEKKDESLSVGEFLVVAGYFQGSGDIEPFRWHPDEGFTIIPFLASYYYGEATGICWDGKRVCGTMGSDEDEQAFLWIKPEPEEIPPVEGGTIGLGANTQAADISGDGLTVVGNGYTDVRVWAWSEEFGMRQLTHMDYGATVVAVGFDGSKAAGYIGVPNGVGGGTNTGVIWDTASGAYTLLPLPDTFDTYQATYLYTLHEEYTGSSSHTQVNTTYYPGHYDGGAFVQPYYISNGQQSNNTSTYNQILPPWPYTVVSTNTRSSSGIEGSQHVTRTWTDQIIQWHVPHNFEPSDMSYDGKFVCGTINGRQTGSEAALWSADSGLQRLGFLPGHDRSLATGVSDDGETVVGFSMGQSVEWFVWTAPRYDEDGNLIDPGGMKSTGIGAAMDVSQGGDLGAGRNTSFNGEAGGKAVLRSRVDPVTGLITETLINDAPVPEGSPTIAMPAQANALTYITWSVTDDEPPVFDQNFEGVLLEIDLNEQLIVTKEPDPAA